MNKHLPGPVGCLAVSLLFATVFLGLVRPAEAYVGPGMELGTLGAAFGMLMTGASAIFYMSVLWVRRLWRRTIGRLASTAKPYPKAQNIPSDP
jgi:hypothetical protein